MSLSEILKLPMIRQQHTTFGMYECCETVPNVDIIARADNNLCLRPVDAVKIVNDAKKARFDCDDFDEMFEYVECKNDHNYAARNKFVIKGEADSDYAMCPITRRSINGNVTRIEGVAIMTKSVVKKMVVPSVTESENIP